jgi:hypothetical protein
LSRARIGAREARSPTYRYLLSVSRFPHEMMCG